MADARITHFDPDPDRLAVIGECMAHYDVGDPEAEWPNNILSRRTVVYGSGAIARRDAPVRHASVDPDELALCRRLADEAAAVMDGIEVGMGSSSGDPFRAFFIAGTADEPAPAAIDAALIRARFGGTIFPPANVTVEPLDEEGLWWGEVEEDGSESGPDYVLPWREMIRWFRERPEFTDTAFVRIGDDALEDLGSDRYPEGTEMPGCVLPRLALGLTRGGSLAGLFGPCVRA